MAQALFMKPTVMKIYRYILAAVAALSVSAAASAQSKNFNMGKWMEIQNSILKELDRSYVDTLPLARIERAGIDAMLEGLDPYTVYVPEEEQENFQMMIKGVYGGIGAVIYKPDVNGNVIINEPYAGSPAVKHGLVCGDEIVAIDGVSTHGMTSADASEKMRGKPGTTVTLRTKKLHAGETWAAGEEVDVPIVRERILMPAIEYVGMIDEETGYIRE